MQFAVYRNCRPGLVDFCGIVKAENMHVAEDIARLMYSCDHANGECLMVDAVMAQDEGEE